MRLTRLYLILLMLNVAGCTSISSTLLNRTDNDLLVGNSNGEPDSHCGARPFKGVPITVRVPTHVDVAIREKVRFFANDNDLKYINTSRRHLFVTTELIYTDKVFTVDVKRPAAGTLNYTMEFGADNNSQYFKSIQSKIQDKTIQDVTAAISSILKAVPTSGEPPSPEVITQGVIEEERMVAWKRFDIDSYDFEQQIAMFVDQHLNCCNSCFRYAATATKSIQPIPKTGESHPVPAPEDLFSTETEALLPLKYEEPIKLFE